MEYKNFAGQKWSIEKGDWISHQFFDAEIEKSNIKKNFSKASFLILYFLIIISLFLMN